jgi:hypothetical protein
MDFVFMRINVLEILMPTDPHIPIRWIDPDAHAHAREPYSSSPMDLVSMRINVREISMPIDLRIPVRWIAPDRHAHWHVRSILMDTRMSRPSYSSRSTCP